MPNTSRLYRYQVIAFDGSSVRNMLVRADVSASTLTLSGLANTEAVGIGFPTTFRLVLQGRGGPKSKTSHARTVTIVMTAAVSNLSVGSRVVVPVFTRSRWTSYATGQVGTYLGASCRCVAKSDGIPDITGRGI